MSIKLVHWPSGPFVPWTWSIGPGSPCPLALDLFVLVPGPLALVPWEPQPLRTIQDPPLTGAPPQPTAQLYATELENPSRLLLLSPRCHYSEQTEGHLAIEAIVCATRQGLGFLRYLRLRAWQHPATCLEHPPLRGVGRDSGGLHAHSRSVYIRCTVKGITPGLSYIVS